MKGSLFLENVSSGNVQMRTQDTPPRRIDSVSDDRFLTVGTESFAGIHLLLDLWDASGLDDADLIERALRDSIKIAGASLLHIHLHHFTPSGGISGIAVLAESHISIHTWPERGYAAIDLFMCGDTHPEIAVPVLKNAFGSSRAEVTNFQRGKVS